MLRKCRLMVAVLMLASLFMFMVIPQAIYAVGIEELKPQQVTAVFNDDLGTDYKVDYIDGSPGFLKDRYKDGNRSDIPLSTITYALSFWNVGKAGGKSGFLFWEKDYGRATLTISTEADGPGIVIKTGSKFGKLQGYSMEPAKSAPEFNSKTYQLEFTGGFSGTFKEKKPYVDDTPITGEIIPSPEGWKVKLRGPMEYFIDQNNPGIKSNQEIVLSMDENPFEIKPEEVPPKVDSGARFSSLQGEVETRPDSDPKGWRFAKLNTVLYVLDRVRTGEDSSAVIGFKDLSTHLLQSESEIVITTPPKKDSKLKLVGGTIWNNVKKLVKDGTMEVETSQAVAGIKGTTFVLSDDGKTSTIKVIEGIVDYKSKQTGKSVLVKQGEMVTATSIGLEAVKPFDVPAEEKIWEEVKNKAIAATPNYEEKLEEIENKAAAPENSITSMIFIAIVAIVLAIAGYTAFRLKRKKVEHKAE